jgi:NTP pyrophosphatase (non-canonical NTP hydrolase)
LVVEHEPPQVVVEASELAQQLAAALGMELHDVVLVVVQLARLGEVRLGEGELADVVQQS